MSSLLDLLANTGPQLSLEVMLRLQDAARAEADPAAAAAIIADNTPASNTTAALWLRALLLEQAKERRAALDLLEALPSPPWGDPASLWLLARARLTLASFGEGQQASPFPLLRLASQAAASYRLLRLADTLWRQAAKAKALGPLRPLRLAFASSFTVDFLYPALRPLLFASGWAPDCYTLPLNQYTQILLGQDQRLAAFAPDFIVVALDSQQASETQASLATLWQCARAGYGASVIQWNFELPWLDPRGRLANLEPQSRRSQLSQLNSALWEAEAAASSVYVLDIDGIASSFGKTAWSDPDAWEISRQYPASNALPLLARHHVALLNAIRGQAAKCVVLDLDGTLWGGVIGEDGLGGIVLGSAGTGAAYRNFQSYLKGLSERGILLAVCSKNNHADALLPFQEHPEMLLRESDITVFVANWQPKDENLRAIAKTLKIGLDSLVFVDDNPAERARVRQFLPEVTTIELPVNPIGYAAALQESLRFEVTALTAEDLLRTASLRSNQEREALASTASNPEEYLAGLAMQVRIAPFSRVDLARIVQLINKTNQFNCTTRRVTEAEVLGWLDDPNFFGLTLRLSDRFGDFGLTAVIHGFFAGEVLRIDNWLMSCRILGRGMDRCLLAATVDAARTRSCSGIEASYIPSPKNDMVSGIYSQFGFVSLEPGPPARFHLPLDQAAINAPAWVSLSG